MSIVFSTYEVQLCKNAIKASYTMRDIAKDLLAKLKAKNVITVEDTYSTVKANSNLISAITDSVALGLDMNVDTSKYGMRIVSDYDLYFNMKTDADYNDFLVKIHFDKNRPEFITLKANRSALRKFVFRAKNNLIAEMELPETPDTRPSAKKAKTDNKPADISVRIEQSIAKASEASVAKTSATGLSDAMEGMQVVESELSHAKSNLLDTLDNADHTNAHSSRARVDALPLVRTFQVPPVKSSLPIIDPTLDATEQEESSQELTNIALGLKDLIPDFKHGNTMLLKYDNINHTIFVSLNEGTEWLGWEHTTAIPLCSSTYRADDGSSTPSTVTDSNCEGEFSDYGSPGEKRVIASTRLTGMPPLSKYRTVPCKSFSKTGMCKFGDKCHFKHA